MIELNNKYTSTFKVIDDDNNIVTGLSQTEFDVNLFDPDKSNRSDLVSVTEIESGFYDYTWTPDITGTWTAEVLHDNYFPWGKMESYVVGEQASELSGIINSISYLTGELDIIKGLVQWNFEMTGLAYSPTNKLVSGVINIYTDNTFTTGIVSLDINADYTTGTDVLTLYTVKDQ